MFLYISYNYAAGEDYLAINNSLEFVGPRHCVNISILSDSIAEEDESFDVLVIPSDATVLGEPPIIALSTVTINDSRKF